MERRHQVFISSTFADLKEERSEIIQALLELDCFPAGMELFPAATDAAWELIKGVIDDSDYYCLVMAGRYGSVDSSGTSYTEKEYDYAISQGKPVMAFVHADPDSLPAGKTEKTEAGKQRLEKFVAKVEQAHHRRAWRTAPELGGLVSRGVVSMRKLHPSEGWVPGRYAASETMLVELANLRAKVAELTAQAVQLSSPATPIEELASGKDQYKMGVNVKLEGATERVNDFVMVSWDDVLRYVGPALINECKKEEFVEKLKLLVYHVLPKTPGKKLASTASVVIPHVVVDKIRVQLQALGQMAPGEKRRAVSDKSRYWRLTETGARQLMNAQAVKKPKPSATPAKTTPKPT
jgi:hypothetical protein